MNEGDELHIHHSNERKLAWTLGMSSKQISTHIFDNPQPSTQFTNPKRCRASDSVSLQPSCKKQKLGHSFSNGVGKSRACDGPILTQNSWGRHSETKSQTSAMKWFDDVNEDITRNEYPANDYDSALHIFFTALGHY